MAMYGKIAETKGQQLHLQVVNVSFMGWFIGTLKEVDGNQKPFTKESVEAWDTQAEASQALLTNDWSQAFSCNIDGMD